MNCENSLLNKNAYTKGVFVPCTREKITTTYNCVTQFDE